MRMGDSFPVMGVCLGHEAIHYVILGYELVKKLIHIIGL